MAATRKLRRACAARARRLVTRRLPWIAAGFGALAAGDARAQSTADVKFLFYKESDGRTQVLNPLLLVHQDLQSLGQVDLLLTYDSISGASPTGAYPTLDVTTSASGTTTSGDVPKAVYRDQRKSAGLTYSRKFGAHLPSVDVSYSRENDYVARSYGVGDAWTLFDGRGTLHLGASFSNDLVEPVTNTLRLPKKSRGFALGWTWIAGARDLFDISASLTKLTGYLDDPYKVVPVGAVTLPEHRPDLRTRRAVLGKYAHYFTGAGGALRTSYRYYWDDWGIHAHTLDLTYDQHVGPDWIVSPQVRLYTQNGASFYGSKFDLARPYMSADYRLSPFDSILGGLSLSYRVRDGLLVSVGGTYEKQHGRDRITPVGTAVVGGGGEDGSFESPAALVVGPSTSPADLTTITVTLGLSYRY